ncbi:unnamed protein product, partial [Nesidiocoris tenuis]
EHVRPPHRLRRPLPTPPLRVLPRGLFKTIRHKANVVFNNSPSTCCGEHPSSRAVITSPNYVPPRARILEHRAVSEESALEAKTILRNNSMINRSKNIETQCA